MSKFSAFIRPGPEEQLFVLGQLAITELFVVRLDFFPPKSFVLFVLPKNSVTI